jgi:hypothetical protein
MSRFKFAVFLAPLLMVASLASADVRVYVHNGPPRAVVEHRPARPDRASVWVAGFHRWDGGSYQWVPGHWEAAPRRGAQWRVGNWRRDRQRGWYWTEGGWR